MKSPAGLSFAALLALSGCGDAERSTSLGYGLTGASPPSVKANHAGDVTLSGVGLTPLSRVYVGGVPIEEVLPVTPELVDSRTLLLHFDYPGPGGEHPTGAWTLGVTDGFRVGAGTPFGIRPFLRSVEHVRTLPGSFDRGGGTFSTWLRPIDHQGALIVPGHASAGSAGLVAADFVSEDVQLFAPGAPAPALATARSVTDAVFDPVNDARPLAVALAIDQSGSMVSPPATASDPGDERITQSQAFVDRLGGGSVASVFEFHGGAGGVGLVVDWTDDKAALKDGLDSLRTGEGGMTPLYDAMIATVSAAGTRSPELVRAAIVLTDGLDNTSTATPADVILLARGLDVPVFAIGLGNPATPGSIDQATLSAIAGQTGGAFYFAEDPAALESVFGSLTEVLRSSYRVEVAFEVDPPLSSAGTYTVTGKLRVTADGEEAVAQLPGFTASIVE